MKIERQSKTKIN